MGDIFLDGGAGGPQLKRNPLGCTPYPMIDLLQVRARALLSGLEDYTGFYELLWELKHFPDATETEKVAAASSVLAALLSENFVEVFSSIWASGSFVPVANDRATALIADPKSWKQPESSESYLAFATTPTGEAAYRGLPAKALEGLWS